MKITIDIPKDALRTLHKLHGIRRRVAWRNLVELAISMIDLKDDMDKTLKGVRKK